MKDNRDMQNNHVPKVSIGMPVYNGAQFIREALDSLLAQTFTDFELIISDNASTDGTEAICREYAATDRRIRYVRQPENSGAMSNFKFVLNEAVGEYFMWAAHDDRWHPDFLCLTKKVHEHDPTVGLVFSGMETKNLLNGDTTRSITGFITSKRKFFRILFRTHYCCPSLIYGLHRRNNLIKIPIKNYDYSEVYIANWYELYYSIRVVPFFLYTAGTKGIRIPHSLTGKLITHNEYIRDTEKLLRNHFSYISTFILKKIIWYFVYKNTKRINRIIRCNSFNC